MDISNFVEVRLVIPEYTENDFSQEEAVIRYGLDLSNVRNYYEGVNNFKTYYGAVTVVEQYEGDKLMLAMDFDEVHDMIYRFKLSTAKMIILAKLN